MPVSVTEIVALHNKTGPVDSSVTKQPWILCSAWNPRSNAAGKKLEAPTLSWSSDPNKNLVDWTIVVTSMPSSGADSVTMDADRNEENPSKKAKMEPETTTYYIHKAILGLGLHVSRLTI